MKIVKGLWYLSARSFGNFTKRMWYKSPEDGHLIGNNNKPTFIHTYEQRYFVDAQEIKIREVRE